RNGREQDEGIERLFNQLVEIVCARDLRLENAAHVVEAFVFNRAIIHHAGCVDDNVDSCQPAPDLVQSPRHARLVGKVTLEDFHLGAECANGANTTDALCSEAVGGNHAQDLVPLGFGRQFAAGKQRQLHLFLAGEMFSDLQPDATKATGDEIDATFAHPFAAGFLCRQPQFVERAYKAARAPKGDDPVSGSRLQFIKYGLDAFLAQTSKPGVAKVNAAGVELRRFARCDQDGAEQGGPVRVDRLVADLR